MIQGTKGVEFMSDNGIRLLRKGGSLVEHASDLLLERPCTPSFQSAHFRVEIPLQGVIEIHDLP